MTDESSHEVCSFVFHRILETLSYINLSIFKENPKDKIFIVKSNTLCMPPLFDEIVHKALSNDVRREILLSLARKEKYLSELALEIKRKPQSIDFHLTLLAEIGLVDSEWREGKKYYFLKDRKVIEFIKQGKGVPAEFRPKPPHEIVLEMWEDMKKRFDALEKRLDRIEKKK